MVFEKPRKSLKCVGSCIFLIKDPVFWIWLSQRLKKKNSSPQKALQYLSWVSNAFVGCGWVERKVARCFRSKKTRTWSWLVDISYISERELGPGILFVSPAGSQSPDHDHRVWDSGVRHLAADSSQYAILKLPLSPCQPTTSCEPWWCWAYRRFPLFQYEHTFSITCFKKHYQYSWVLYKMQVWTINFLMNIFCVGLCSVHTSKMIKKYEHSFQSLISNIY